MQRARSHGDLACQPVCGLSGHARGLSPSAMLRGHRHGRMLSIVVRHTLRGNNQRASEVVLHDCIVEIVILKVVKVEAALCGEGFGLGSLGELDCMLLELLESKWVEVVKVVVIEVVHVGSGRLSRWR